jgi:flagellar assembly factor FliW
MTANAALAETAPIPMFVESDLLGTLEVEASDVLSFASGLFGFPEAHDFVLLPASRESLYWLQSTEHSALTFLLVDPFVTFEEYGVELGAGDRRDLQIASESRVAILAIVRLPGAPGEPARANLQGPLAFNLDARRAKQLAIAESDYGVACEFELPGR